MSRVGKYPIAVPEGVTVDITDKQITVKGKNGELSTQILGNVKVTMEEGSVSVTPTDNSKFSRAMWGTTRSNIHNLVVGVTDGFKKGLELRGVGYRVAHKGNVLILSLGYSHDTYFVLPEGISATVEKQTLIELTGANKQTVGQVASEIRALRKPEPYKGKGVRYVGEYVRMKEGKKK
ncbi:MAG: 50S ribosomal protein L6 [Rickettsiales bacterium]|nr:50S ribosomal protein L6 [Rickettsiales bacterium]